MIFYNWFKSMYILTLFFKLVVKWKVRREKTLDKCGLWSTRVVEF